MNEIMQFVAVEFVDDINVVGYTYWYLCPTQTATVGCQVVAPLGRHNNLQQGVVRKVIYADEFDAPYPLWGIKSIKKVLTNENE